MLYLFKLHVMNSAIFIDLSSEMMFKVCIWRRINLYKLSICHVIHMMSFFLSNSDFVAVVLMIFYGVYDIFTS